MGELELLLFDFALVSNQVCPISCIHPTTRSSWSLRFFHQSTLKLWDRFVFEMGPSQFLGNATWPINMQDVLFEDSTLILNESGSSRRFQPMPRMPRAMPARLAWPFDLRGQGQAEFTLAVGENEAGTYPKIQVDWLHQKKVYSGEVPKSSLAFWGDRWADHKSIRVQLENCLHPWGVKGWSQKPFCHHRWMERNWFG